MVCSARAANSRKILSREIHKLRFVFVDICLQSGTVVIFMPW